VKYFLPIHTFVDRQMHIATEMSDFYIDLVFYIRIFVA